MVNAPSFKDKDSSFPSEKEIAAKSPDDQMTQEKASRVAKVASQKEIASKTASSEPLVTSVTSFTPQASPVPLTPDTKKAVEKVKDEQQKQNASQTEKEIVASSGDQITREKDSLIATAAAQKEAEVPAMNVLLSGPQGVVFSYLSPDELSLVEVASKEVEPKLDQKAIDRAKLGLDIEIILKRNPTWRKPIASWKEISLSDQLWLLRILELNKLMKLNLMDEKAAKDVDFIFTSLPGELLKKDVREAIEGKLAAIKELKLGKQGIEVCPDAICLLVNLERLDLSENPLKEPPDLRKNNKLRHVDFYNCGLEVPPDFSQNPELISINLTRNRLKEAPILSSNLKIETVYLSTNQLTKPPITSNNVLLRHFILSYNNLDEPPSLLNNTQLEYLDISHNSLKSYPDLRNNAKLAKFIFRNNQFKTLPDIRNNPLLNILDIELGQGGNPIPPRTIGRDFYLLGKAFYNAWPEIKRKLFGP